MGAFNRLKLYYQTDYRLDRRMNKYGCAIRSLIAYPELRYGYRFEPDEIMEIVGESLESGHIKPSYDFINPGGVVEIAAEHLGVNAWCYDIGSRKGSGSTYWQHVKKSGNFKHDFTLLKWATDGPEGMHFTLGDYNGAEVYDPYPVDLGTTADYELLMRFEEIR